MVQNGYILVFIANKYHYAMIDTAITLIVTFAALKCVQATNAQKLQKVVPNSIALRKNLRRERSLWLWIQKEQ
jgi:hypothetical protein